MVRLPIQTIERISTTAHQLAVPIDFSATSEGWCPVSRNGNETATAVATIETIKTICGPRRF
jgi:hypothetical protein